LMLEHGACGHFARAELVCGHCAQPLDARNTRLHAGPGLPKEVAKSRTRELARLREQRASKER